MSWLEFVMLLWVTWYILLLWKKKEVEILKSRNAVCFMKHKIIDFNHVAVSIVVSLWFLST